MTTTQISSDIQKIIDTNDTVLFMKGTALFPQCGFSGFVTQALQNLNVEFCDVNILENPELRQGIKDFSNWPTIPQLYVKGDFIGGADIVKEMLQSGELKGLFSVT